ncbi:MAG: hypothetical protein CMI57_00155 [Parcubacteria group bacterium]|jgi:hypothetical protein|nr:hypothetical protein [Parcubacteria group bacterium]
MISITTKMILNYYAIVNNRPPVARNEDGSAGGGWGRNADPSERGSPAAPPRNFTGGTEQKFPFPF